MKMAVFFPDVFPDLLLCRFLFRKIRARWLIHLKTSSLCLCLTLLVSCSLPMFILKSVALTLNHFTVKPQYLWYFCCSADLKLIYKIKKNPGCIIDFFWPSVRSLKDFSKVIHLYTYFWASSNFWFTFKKKKEKIHGILLFEILFRERRPFVRSHVRPVKHQNIGRHKNIF